MNKLFIFCTLLFSLAQIGQLSAQNKNLLMGVGNDNTHGQYNTSYGFIDRPEGVGISGVPPYTGGNRNSFMGANTGNFNAGSDNTTIGFAAGGWFMSGSQNVLIGSQTAGNFLSYSKSVNVGTGNSILGFQAGLTNQTDYNVFVGYQSGYSNTTGPHNVFVGPSTGYANAVGGDNAFVGYQAGKANTTGGDNTFIGSLAGQSNTAGSFNSFIGSYTGQANTTGRQNSFLGYATGELNTSGGSNTFLGAWAGGRNTAGNQNSFVGLAAGFENTTGTNNTFMGYYAGYNVTTGSNNIIIGPNSGTAVTDGSDNVLMGYNSQAEDGLHNATAIGTNSRVAISNALILGNQVNVGIGTSAPATRLEVVSESPDESGLRLTHLTSQSPSAQATDQFLTVNDKGDLIKARYQLRINNASEWSDRVFSQGYALRPLSSVAAYVGQHGHLPGIPSAEEVAEKGIDLTKLNAALLEKIEELTLYSIQLEKDNRQLRDSDQLRSQELQAQRTKMEGLAKKQAQLEQLLQQVLNRK